MAEMRAAQQSAHLQSRFKTKHLNQWVSSRDGFFNVADWQSLVQPGIRREHYKDCPCYIAADFASHLDLTAVMQVFILPDGGYAIFGSYYLPEQTINLPQNQHYRNWHIGGHLKIAGESVMDFESVRSDIMQMMTDYQVVEFVLDPTRMWGESSKYEREGIPVVAYRQVVLTMSQPMKDMEALITDGKIAHDGDPILAWAVGNVTAKADQKNNVYPTKDSIAQKIDPVIAILFALGRAATRDPDPGQMIYF
jgi:phage terminase large subunit-like protein